MRNFLSILAIFLSLAIPALAGQPAVKLSSSGICHDVGSAWYGRTRTYTAFDTMEACLAHGRAPKDYSQSAPVPVSRGYDRSLFGGWADFDGDCLNTRHEVLAQLSTGRLVLSNDNCRVVRGRWNDPYTGKIFLEARKMDIDHLVPLYWAWQHGADQWSNAKREKFANDPVNLFAVDAGTNRAKGAKGPLEWLPPNAAFHCQYVLRFKRLMKTYGLTYPAADAARFEQQMQRLCG